MLPRAYWSNDRIQTEFNASRRLVEVAMKLLEEKGPYSTPDPMKARRIPESTVATVKEFYNSDDISRCMPGMKDKVKVTEGSVRVNKQKRLLLWPIYDIYDMFVKENSVHKIGFASFTTLRPEECIFAGKQGTHNVCVCMTHENARLMCKAISKLTEITNEKELIKQITCPINSLNCALNKCDGCLNLLVALKYHIHQIVEDAPLDHISFDQWCMQDRYSLIKISKQPTEFVNDLFNFCTDKLKIHNYVAIQQAKFLKKLKEDLNEGEYIFIMDFSENFSMITQNEIQAAHFNKVQATIHPIVAYYKNAIGELENISWIAISDHLKHNTVAVHMFQGLFIKFIEKNHDTYPAMNKIFYFTDGSAAQYKNKKNFMNLCYHEQDFGIKAEWHFFATAHGKGPSDGLGGTIKREARKASLRGTKISSAEELFAWANNWSETRMLKIKYCNIKTMEIDDHEKFLLNRFSNLKSVEGTHKYHCIIPDTTKPNSILTKITSNCLEKKKYTLKR